MHRKTKASFEDFKRFQSLGKARFALTLSFPRSMEILTSIETLNGD